MNSDTTVTASVRAPTSLRDQGRAGLFSFRDFSSGNKSGTILDERAESNWLGDLASIAAGVVVGVAVTAGCLALTAGAGSIACAVAGGMAGGTVSNVIRQATSNKPFSWGSFAFDVIVGGVAGPAAKLIAPAASAAVKAVAPAAKALVSKVSSAVGAGFSNAASAVSSVASKAASAVSAGVNKSLGLLKGGMQNASGWLRGGTSNAAAEAGAATRPVAGQPIYRVYGGDSAAGGASWSPVNPGSVANYRSAAGLPSGGASGATNTGQFVIEGTLNDPAAVVLQRRALSLDGTLGGLPEYIIPNWMNNGSITITRVSGANPEF